MRRSSPPAALKSLADEQKIGSDVVKKAREDLAIDPDKPNPRLA